MGQVTTPDTEKKKLISKSFFFRFPLSPVLFVDVDGVGIETRPRQEEMKCILVLNIPLPPPQRTFLPRPLRSSTPINLGALRRSSNFPATTHAKIPDVGSSTDPSRPAPCFPPFSPYPALSRFHAVLLVDYTLSNARSDPTTYRVASRFLPEVATMYP